ncbi:MAG: L-aspartate oxidase, partial [Proteobacteria bacterium]|nr:L-aspartate oxidase [Pseudomonadota bacterium]
GVLFKKDLAQSSTNWAQGGIAAVTTPDDNFELHIKDTEVAGAGLCHSDAVRVVVTEGPARVRELIERGIQFDESSPGTYHLHQEGGHSRRRIFHAADRTGKEIQATLLRAAQASSNITFVPHANAIDIITSHKLGIGKQQPNRALGAYVLLASGAIESFVADKILIATGGAGKVYLYTSNPDVVTGDGIAMAFRAGARVANMEFFQFHPTCLFHPQAKSFLITEAMRGEGAVLKGLDGKPFMQEYHPLKDLAPRDIVARAIDHEMKEKGYEHVWLDSTHKSREFLQEHFPTIYERCRSLGIDIATQPIPVVPAAHYLCGGIVSDLVGRTDIENLYCAGECAHTGLHGANRLASNSLLEGLVFGYRAAMDAIAHRNGTQPTVPIPPWNPGQARDSDEEVVITQNWDEIRRLMWNYVGIVRSTKRLQRALSRLELIEREIQEYYWNFTVTSDLLELRNLCLVAKLVVRCALARKESRGLHYTIDFPGLNEGYQIDTTLCP